MSFPSHHKSWRLESSNDGNEVKRRVRNAARQTSKKETHRIIFEEKAADEAEQRKLEAENEKYAQDMHFMSSPFLDDDSTFDLRDDDFDPFED